MSHPDEDRLVIESVREDGRPFRPSDWIERISTMLASFGPDHRLHYASGAQPCVIQGEKCLVVERNLEQKDPASYAYILKFAHDNGLRIHECRRQRSETVAEERRQEPPTAA